MKIFLKTVLLSFLIVPLVSSASIPAFPMTFWGEVSVDSVAAPAGSIVRVYAEAVEVGQITVTEAGVYGYTEPTRQKLLVGEGDGVLTFTIQSPNINNGIETKGTTPVNHPSFIAGETVELNINVDIAEEVVAPSGGGGSSSSGGGGGGSSSKKIENATEQVLGAATSTENLTEEEQKIELQKKLIEILTLLISLLQQKILLGA